MAEKPKLFVLLIDGDNVQQVTLIPKIMDKISEFGKPIIKKLYINNNSFAQIENWNGIINEYSIKPEWIPNNTTRKNAADIALVMDAMDILFNRADITGFCIVSSDSDFTRLAAYIVEKNRFMLGIGESKTHKSFVNACSRFIYIEDIEKVEAEPVQKILTEEILKPSEEKLPSFEELFVQAYEICLQSNANDGLILLAEIKEEMNSLDTEFQSSELQNMRRLAEHVKVVADSYPVGVIKIDEKLENKPVIHYINIDCDAFKFVEAYRQAPRREANGWVLLSVIGGELSKDAKYENGFSYQGVRRKQLSKAVIEMVKLYPAIEIREDKDGTTITHFVRIKS
jgi:uncharacterized LabA/DUF88 family protein